MCNSKNFRVLKFCDLVDFEIYMFLLRMEVFLIERKIKDIFVKVLFISSCLIFIILRFFIKVLFNNL